MINKVSWKYIFNYCHQDLSGKLLPFNTSSSLEEINTNESILKKKKQANCNLCVYGSIEDLLVAAALEKMLPMDFNKENWFFGHKKSLFKLTFSFRVNGRCWIDVAFLFQPGQKLKKMSPFCDVIRCNVLGHQRAIQKNRTTLFQEIAPHKSSLQHHTNSSLLRTTETEHFPTVLHFRSEQNHWSLTMTDSSKKKTNLDWSRDRDFVLYAK